MCNPGREKSDGQDLCVECVAGKFKIETGDHLCRSCLSTSFLLDTGATSSEVCLYMYKITISFSIYRDVELISVHFANRLTQEVSSTCSEALCSSDSCFTKAFFPG